MKFWVRYLKYIYIKKIVLPINTSNEKKCTLFNF